MRTAEQGQASRSAGEGRPPKERGPCLGPPSWAAGEYPTDCHKFVERYQFTARTLRTAGLVYTGRSILEHPFFVVFRRLLA